MKAGFKGSAAHEHQGSSRAICSAGRRRARRGRRQRPTVRGYARVLLLLLLLLPLQLIPPAMTSTSAPTLLAPL